MGLMEKTFVVTSDEYNSGAGLDCYKKKYKLLAGKEGDSKVFAKWVFPQKYDPNEKESYPGDKAFPMSIDLPKDYVEAVFALLKWAAALAKEEDIDFQDCIEKFGRTVGRKRKATRSRQPQQSDDDFPPLTDDDIPF